MPCLGPSRQRTQGNQGAYVSCIRLTTLPKFVTIADSYIWFYLHCPRSETDNSDDDDRKTLQTENSLPDLFIKYHENPPLEYCTVYMNVLGLLLYQCLLGSLMIQ